MIFRVMIAIVALLCFAGSTPSPRLDGEACPSGSACQCENHWYFTGGSPPPSCHSSVDVYLASNKHACCNLPTEGCNTARNCSGIVHITAKAVSGQTCVYQISGPNASSSCAPGGCATLEHNERYDFACLDWSQYVVQANGSTIKTVIVDCDNCPG